MNGVEMVLALRSQNYEGPAILRTSEEKSDLLNIHPRFSDMVKTKIITSVLDKKNHKSTKGVIEEILFKEDEGRSIKTT